MFRCCWERVSKHKEVEGMEKRSIIVGASAEGRASPFSWEEGRESVQSKVGWWVWL